MVWDSISNTFQLRNRLAVNYNFCQNIESILNPQFHTQPQKTSNHRFTKKFLSLNIQMQYEQSELAILGHTVVAIGKFTSTVLWSKIANFRWIQHNIKMQLHHWELQAFIPHNSTFKWGIHLCFSSRGSKVISYQILNV